MVITPILQTPQQVMQNADDIKKANDDSRNKPQQISASTPNSPITGGPQGQTISAQAIGPSVKIDISAQGRETAKGKDNSQINTDNKGIQTKSSNISVKA